MSFSLTSPITGATVPGFTTPGYTHTPDVAPTINAKQFAITGVTGTQIGVDAHSVSKPFTLTFVRPAVLKTMPTANPVTGVFPANIPTNKFLVIARKGVLCASGVIKPLVIRLEISVPAGSDTFDPAEVKASISAFFGALSQQSSGIAQTCIDGIM